MEQKKEQGKLDVQTNSLSSSSEGEGQPECDFRGSVRVEDLNPRLRQFVKALEGPNKLLQTSSKQLAKEATLQPSMGQFPLNTYAFHPPGLIGSLHLLVGPAVERGRIEQLFTEVREGEQLDNTHGGW